MNTSRAYNHNAGSRCSNSEDAVHRWQGTLRINLLYREDAAMKKYLMLAIALAAVLTCRLTVGQAAREETSKKSSSEFGSAVAKAHPKQARAMLAAAQKTWEATSAGYDVGTETLSHVHFWSKQLLSAERASADTKEEDLAALRDYWKRTKQTYLKVQALYNTGIRGGETEKFAAASYYLAEAELWLLDAGGSVPDNVD